MAEDKRANPFPFPTLAEIMSAPGTREEKAARFVVTRHMGGIPCRAFLVGDNDHSIVMRGVRDLTTAAFNLVDALTAEDEAAYIASLTTLRAILETPVVPVAVEALSD